MNTQLPTDSRHIANGRLIPSEGYADQPYVVKTDDGAWLCVMTTGKGNEGDAGQHVVAMRSTDQGCTWTDPVAIEPADGPEASYAVLFKAPGGRVYAFYNHNTDSVREVKREDGGVYRRVDSLGHYVFKFSDDHGRTWSARRYEVPIREFACDRANVYGGQLRFFWNVGRPIVAGNAMLLPHHKVGAMGPGFFAQSEGVFLRSENILTERDPERLRFETLPAGDIGLRTPPGGGRIAEEQSVVELSDGSLFCVYRSVDGWPVHAYSRDGGRTWAVPAYLTYSPGGRRVKHPRAANFVWKCANGKYLYWFHNHGGTPLLALPREWGPYQGRNPVWLCAGVERDSPAGKVLHWSQPEILLYDDDPAPRMSYPDLVEDVGKFFVTETQKTIARAHEIPAILLDGLFGQFDSRQLATGGLVSGAPSFGGRCSVSARQHELGPAAATERRPPPSLPSFSLDLWLQLDSLAAGQEIVAGKGVRAATTDTSTLELLLDERVTWRADAGILQTGKLHHVVITVDGGPKIITFVVDGVLCDGGDERQFGWGRFDAEVRPPTGPLTIASAVRRLRLYNRPLRTSEAVGNWRAAEEP